MKPNKYTTKIVEAERFSEHYWNCVVMTIEILVRSQVLQKFSTIFVLSLSRFQNNI